MKSHITHITHSLKNFTLTTPTAIIFGAIIISVGLVAHGALSTNGTTITNPFKGKPVDSKEYVEGTSKKVFVIEYSDTECPFCTSLHPTIKKIREEYKDKITYVYRSFPLTNIHPNAFKEAEGLYCAGKVGGSKAYYDFMTALFDYKTANNTMALPENWAEMFSTQVGIDQNAVKACIDTDEMAEAVNASMADGQSAGVSGTPTTFVLVKERGGFRVVSEVSGAQSYDYFKKAIEQALSGK